MKPIPVVLNQALRCNSYVAGLSSSLLCFAVTAFALAEHRDFVADTELRVARELAAIAPLPPSPQEQQAKLDREKADFVAKLIRDERPSHPDSDAIARIIVDESLKANIDPLFVTAVVRAESMFRHKAVSQRGAKGLMQLMPQTGKHVAKLSNIELKTIEDLHNPETNIRLGIWYLKYLEQRFNGSREKLLVAYNWGPSNLSRALTTKTSYPRESLQYVKKVLSRHTLWSDQLAQLTAARATTAVG
jgi:soluble lytic murein transglycosylase-like protein